MARKTMILLGAACLSLASACQTRHQVELAPVEIKPIHITIDVNVKVDRALDDFFGEIDEAAKNVEKTSADPE